MGSGERGGSRLRGEVEAEFQGESQVGRPSENCESCAFTSWFSPFFSVSRVGRV